MSPDYLPPRCISSTPQFLAAGDDIVRPIFATEEQRRLLLLQGTTSDLMDSASNAAAVQQSKLIF
jgi:hypothetical protein